MNMIFVFGSNLAGVHGAGAARYAYERMGAEMGIGEGRTGNCYALPTKDHRIMSLPMEEVIKHVELFIEHANAYPEFIFKVTRIGCGLAGFDDADIAPLFKAAPKNCRFDHMWFPYLGNHVTYWGTF